MPIISETLQGQDNVVIKIEVDQNLVAVNPPSNVYGNMRSGDSVPSKVFQEGMNLIRTCAEQVAKTIGDIAEATRPNEVEVQLGVKMDGKAGAFVAKTGIEGQLQVKLKWVKGDA